MAYCNIQDHFQCCQCKSAADMYGRECKHGMLFPVMLIMAGENSCPNYEFDVNKVKEQLSEKQNRQ